MIFFYSYLLISFLYSTVYGNLLWDPSLQQLKNGTRDSMKVTIVESIPEGSFNIDLLPGTKYTWEALINEVDNAKKNLLITAMYWNLLGKDDRKLYTESEMKEFGADHGINLYNALKRAAKRGVEIRLLCGNLNSKDANLPPEVTDLIKISPNNVYAQNWDAKDWYGGGIMHQKIWIFDEKHIYLGSANMDWKSLSQVMEMGVLINNSPKIAKDAKSLFEIWWKWTSPSFPKTTTTYWSKEFQALLRVPTWSKFVSLHKRSQFPFQGEQFSTKYNINHPYYTFINQDSIQSGSYISAAPMAVVGPNRTFDQDSLVYTIQSATKQLNLNVMEYQASSKYSLPTSHDPKYWSALNQAVLSIIYSKGVDVRFLISQWNHTSNEMLLGLNALQNEANLCQSMWTKCKGKLTIKLFRVPGWNQTSTDTNKSIWPSFSRVNHGKWILSDTRLNIGTSNMLWSYMYTTAGASWNTNSLNIREKCQQIFERNWNSPYAIDLSQVLKEKQLI